jgi:hypothetical protein
MWCALEPVMEKCTPNEPNASNAKVSSPGILLPAEKLPSRPVMPARHVFRCLLMIPRL